MTLQRVNAHVGCAPDRVNFKKRAIREAKTQERGEPNLRSAVKNKIPILSAATNSAESSDCDQREKRSRWLGHCDDLDRETVGAGEVCVAEGIKRRADAASFIEIQAVRVVGYSKGGICHDGILYAHGIGALHSRGDRRSTCTDGKGIVDTTEENASVGAGVGVDRRSEGLNRVVSGSVHDRDERENRLGHARCERIGSSKVRPRRGLVGASSEEHRVRDIDVLAHLVIAAVRLCVLSRSRQSRPESNSDSIGAGEESEGG